MKAKFILADSGGTSTKWLIALTTEERVTVETRSLHPRNIKDEKAVIDEIRSMFSDFDAPVYFYGAGCSSEQNQLIIQRIFNEAGIFKVAIHADSIGMCRGLLGDNPGNVAILGTGSILVEYDGTSIVQRHGGYGPIVGDEGSGINFAKLLVRYALEQDTWTDELKQLFGTKHFIYAHLAQTDVFAWLGSLAHRMQAKSMEFIHQANFQEFVNTSVTKLEAGSVVHVGGSYGYHKRTILNHVLKEHGYELGQCVINPLEKLAQYHWKKLS